MPTSAASHIQCHGKLSAGVTSRPSNSSDTVSLRCLHCCHFARPVGGCLLFASLEAPEAQDEFIQLAVALDAEPESTRLGRRSRCSSSTAPSKASRCIARTAAAPAPPANTSPAVRPPSLPHHVLMRPIPSKFQVHSFRFTVSGSQFQVHGLRPTACGASCAGCHHSNCKPPSASSTSAL